MAKDISANVELEGGSIEVTPSLSDLTLAADADIRGLIPVERGKAAQSDWNETDSESLSFIQNKPSFASSTGDGSVIEGCITGDGANEASGGFSHAEGVGTKATANNAHAEGSATTASEWASHAEGRATTASGGFSHAEGIFTVAAGTDAHAEGVLCQANANHSHAEGNRTVVDGNSGHAEGRETKASADYTHSEGYRTLASSNVQHVQGKYNIEDTNETYAHIVGNGSADDNRSNAHTLDWSGNAWYSGTVTADGTPTNSNDLVPKSWVEDKGYLTEQAQSDWTEEDNTSASYVQNRPSIVSGTGANSIIEGSVTGASANIASGRYAHAKGLQTKALAQASYAEGILTEASGMASHAESHGTVANGIASHAEGAGTIASSAYQHVQGKLNIEDANGIYAHIVGNGNSSARSNAHTLDWYGNAWYSGKVTADGTPTNDNDLVSKKWVEDKGYLTEQAQSDWNETDDTSASYVQNKPNIASGTGNGSVIEGCISGNNANVATSNFAHAEGVGTIANAKYCHAEGGGTICNGTYSHAEGCLTSSNSVHSHSEGYGTIASSASQHVQGRYNIEDTEGTYAHIVGNGTSDSTRSNAHTLDWSGNAWYQGKVTAEGTPTESNDLVSKKWVEDKGYLTQHQDISSKADKSEIPTKVSDLSNDSEFINGLTELEYGVSTWAEFTAARNAKKIVYCRCPMSGNSYRYAFLAYVSNTNVEFQYYRSVNAHTASQMGDQVFVYTLSSNGTWTTTTREASSKVIAGTGLNSSYTKDKLTLSIKSDYPTKAEVSAMIAEALAAYENGNTE